MGNQSVRRAMCDRIKQHVAAYQQQPLNEAVYTRMLALDREDFGGSHADSPGPIGYGQTISQPFMVAMMTDLLLRATDQRDVVCEIGTGSGYQAAILAHFFQQVRSIETVQPLADAAAKRLQAMGLSHIQVIQGDGLQLPEASFSGLIATCGVTGPIPLSWGQSLQVGGAMLLPHAPTEADAMQIVLWRKTGSDPADLEPVQLLDHPLFCRFVPFVRG